MLIQIILTLALLGYFAYAHFQRRTSRVVSTTSAFVSVFGLALVWNPGVANTMAHVAGVGRGADLVFYVFIAVASLISLYLHLRVEACTHLVTDLARAMALSSPRLPGDRRRVFQQSAG